MKVGTEDLRKTVAAGTLLVLAFLLFARWIFGSQPAALADKAASEIRTTEPARSERIKFDSADPTLHLVRLELAEHEQYLGGGRNIFRSHDEEQTKKARPKQEPQTIPPISIPSTTSRIELKFFGIASTSNGPTKACFTQDGEVFIGSSGEIVDRRYKILRIDWNIVDLEDLLKHRELSLTLQQ